MIRGRRTIAAAITAMACLVLTACVLMPGQFTSDMTVNQDGRFAFHYAGEIVLLPLAEATEKARKAKVFTADTCYEDDGTTERACSGKEIAEQKKQWEQRKADSEAHQKGQAEMAKGMFGGIDPSDPRAGAQFAEKLGRQAGWRKVSYKGNGVFEVDFAVDGTLDHDFVFPTVEGFPMANAFVQAVRRNDGTVRIDAPSFGPDGGGMPMQAMMMGAMAAGGEGGDSGPKVPVASGSFILRTDAAILANNTDEGPRADTAGQVLSWKVDASSKAAPTALLKLAR